MKWISVKDRLPIDNGGLQVFLVARNQKSASHGNFLVQTEYFTDKFNGPDNIVYWMSIPKPPKE